MDHKKQYKHRTAGVEGVRRRRRSSESAFRKEKRAHVLNAKRFRHGKGDQLQEEVTVDETKAATEELLKHGTHRLACLQKLRRAFTQGSAYADAFFGVENSLSCLIGIFTGNDSDLQIEAAWCLSNLSGGLHDHLMTLTMAAAPYLVTYLSSSNHLLQDQCAWTLGNLAADGEEYQTILKSQGCLKPLIELLKSQQPRVIESSGFALSNMLRGSLANASELVEAGVIPNLLTHISTSNTELDILAEIAWVITYLAVSHDVMDKLVEAGVLEKVIPVIIEFANAEEHNAQVLTPLLRCLGNMCSGKNEHSERACTNDQLMPAMSKCLASSHRHIRKETLWVLSNITGPESVCQALIDEGLLTHVIELLSAAYDIKSEALYLVCNMAFHGSDYCRQLLELDVMPKVVDMLRSHDLETMHMALSFIEMTLRMTKEGKHIFEESKGMDGLALLEYHTNEELRTRTNDILETYFYNKDEEAT